MKNKYKNFPVLGRDKSGNLHNYALVSNYSKIDDMRCGSWLTQNVDASEIALVDGYRLEKWDWKNTNSGDILTKRTIINQ